MKTIKTVLLSTLVFLMSACNNNSNDSENATEVEDTTIQHIMIARPTQEVINPAGIWIGYQSILTENGKGVFDMKTLIYDGKFYGVSEDANIFYSGSYEMAYGKYLMTNSMEDSNTSYRIYDIFDDGNAIANGMTALHIKEEESFSGAFENDLYQEGEVSATFTELYNKPSSLEYIYGDVNTSKVNLNITQSGVISGTLKDCQIDGDISVLDSSINMYKLNFGLSTCNNIGTYEGLGVVALDSNNSAYFMALASAKDGLRMEAFLYYLKETPLEFIEELSLKKSSTKKVIYLHDEYTFQNSLIGDIYYNKYAKDSNLEDYVLDAGFYDDNGNFIDLSLEGVDFGGANLNGITAVGKSFENSKFSYTKDSEIIGATMIKADLRRSSFKNADISNSDLRGVNFEDSNLRNVDFSNSNLSYAYLVGADKTASITTLATFANAWWIDGTRCNSISIGNCSPKDDNSLTYEEYLNATKTTIKAIDEKKKGLLPFQFLSDIDYSKVVVEADGGIAW